MATYSNSAQYLLCSVYTRGILSGTSRTGPSRFSHPLRLTSYPTWRIRRMFLRSQLRKKDGKEHTCWSVVKTNVPTTAASVALPRRGQWTPNAPPGARPSTPTPPARTPAERWAFYTQLVPVEEAFKNLKGDWRVRPVYQQKMERIAAQDPRRPHHPLGRPPNGGPATRSWCQWRKPSRT